MEDPNQPPATGTTATLTEKYTSAAKKKLLILNCILLSIGTCGGPLIMRLYYIHGGHRIWMIGFITTVGWPFIFIILIVLYFHRRSAVGKINNNSQPTTLFYMRRKLFVGIALLGILNGLDSYLYAYSVACLPVSTYTLINATRLVFMAVFAFILVKQKFSPYSINAVVLLTFGSAMLAFHSGGDRPEGERKATYVTGLAISLVATALSGLLSPLTELTYNKSKQEMTYTLVLEVQMVTCLFATLFSTAGMILNNDFKAVWREAEDFGLGGMKYYAILSGNIVLWQCFFLGMMGVIFYGGSLLLGVVLTVQIPVMEVLGVMLYGEKFKSEKGVALVLSVWGCVSYFYGEYLHMKKMKHHPLSANGEGV